MEKIQELTDKIRREGVEKGQEEAARIVAEAKQQAAKIVADAKTQAEAIAQKAKKDAAELEQNTKSELKLYTSQALNALKSEITNVVTDKVVGQSVKALTDGKDFLGRFAVALATQWGWTRVSRLRRSTATRHHSACSPPTEAIAWTSARKSWRLTSRTSCVRNSSKCSSKLYR